METGSPLSLPAQGAIALVCYVPDGISEVLGKLRKAIPSSYDARPHITILPPRPLTLAVADLIPRLSQLLAVQTAFSVELNEISLFTETNLLHFEIEEGAARLNELHALLNSGELHHQELHDFKPHLTIGGPYDPVSAPAALAEANGVWRSSSCCRKFDVDEVVLLWLDPNNRHKDCRYLATFSLNSQSPGAEVALAATAAAQT